MPATPPGPSGISWVDLVRWILPPAADSSGTGLSFLVHRASSRTSSPTIPRGHRALDASRSLDKERGVGIKDDQGTPVMEERKLPNGPFRRAGRLPGGRQGAGANGGSSSTPIPPILTKYRRPYRFHSDAFHLLSPAASPISRAYGQEPEGTAGPSGAP